MKPICRARSISLSLCAFIYAMNSGIPSWSFLTISATSGVISFSFSLLTK